MCVRRWIGADRSFFPANEPKASRSARVSRHQVTRAPNQRCKVDRRPSNSSNRLSQGVGGLTGWSRGSWVSDRPIGWAGPDWQPIGGWKRWDASATRNALAFLQCDREDRGYSQRLSQWAV